MKAAKYVMLLVAFFTLNACDNNHGQNGFDTQDEKNNNDYETPATTPPSPDNTNPNSTTPNTTPSTSDTSVTDTSNRSMNP